MALVLAYADRWTPINHDYEFFLRADELTGRDHRIRLEVSGGLDDVRCLSLIPAGFWLRRMRRSQLYVPGTYDPYDTNQFRYDTEEPH
jgi:hypothetical protein